MVSEMTSPRKRAYSNSEIQKWKNCPLSWRFAYDLGLVSREGDDSQHHQKFGAAYHDGLAELYRGHGLRAAQAEFIRGYPTQLDPDDRAKTQANGVSALAQYVRQWKDEDKKWRVVEIETQSDDEEAWSVKPDLVMENMDWGGIYLWDHKTTGSIINAKYWEQFNPNSQITHYMSYGREKFGEIAGFIINAISFQYRAPKKSNGDSNVLLCEENDPKKPWLAFSDYETRFVKGRYHRDMVAAWGFSVQFERQMFNRRDEQLEYEQLSREAWIRDLEAARSTGFYRSNTDSCRRCDFKSICSAGWEWELDEELILTQFRRACRQRFGSSQHCILDLNHDGEHSDIDLSSAELNVEVDI